MAVILGLPLLYRPDTPTSSSAANRLVIISPHNEQIRFEINRAFHDYCIAVFDEEVEIDWRVIGGSNDVVKLLSSQYEALVEQGKEDEGSGFDLVFGGGDYLFDTKLKPGITVHVPGQEPRHVSILEPIDLPEAYVKEVFPTQELAGRPLYDPDGYWFGVVLTSFGIVYNLDVLDHLGVDKPMHWSDLTDPRYFNWIALADPSHSGSICVTYEAILKQSGWDAGWALLRRVCANARYFASSSSQVPIDVASGEAAVGMSIDFYGRYQAQVVGQDRVGYVPPPNETLVNADPVGILRGAPHPELARRFVKWLLSERGQLLWNLPVGHELGPVKYELRRAPIRRDVYPEFGQQMIDRENPFEFAKPMPEDAPSYYSIIPTVLHSMAIDILPDLKEAWQAIIHEDDPQQRAEMEEVFDRMPFDFEQLRQAKAGWKKDPHAETRDRVNWTKFFRDQYREVVRLSGK
jgi:ABC-type Fe3+ transport system substrate-binding protein